MNIYLKTGIAWIILAILSTNIIGLVIRSMYPTKKSYHSELSLSELMNENNPNPVLSIVYLLFAAAYLFALYHFWNIWLALAGLILMLTRIPDLLFEIRTGEKVNMVNMPKRPIDVFCTIFMWGTLPLIWYAFHMLIEKSI